MTNVWMRQGLVFVPWIRLAGDRRHMRLDISDIVKTVITSAVVAGVVMYGTQRVLEAELQILKEDFRHYKTAVHEIERELSRRKPMADYVERNMQRGRP